CGRCGLRMAEVSPRRSLPRGPVRMKTTPPASAPRRAGRVAADFSPCAVVVTVPPRTSRARGSAGTERDDDDSMMSLVAGWKGRRLGLVAVPPPAGGAPLPEAVEVPHPPAVPVVGLLVGQLGPVRLLVIVAGAVGAGVHEIPDGVVAQLVAGARVLGPAQVD